MRTTNLGILSVVVLLASLGLLALGCETESGDDAPVADESPELRVSERPFTLPPHPSGLAVRNPPAMRGGHWGAGWSPMADWIHLEYNPQSHSLGLRSDRYARLTFLDLLLYAVSEDHPDPDKPAVLYLEVIPSEDRPWEVREGWRYSCDADDAITVSEAERLGNPYSWWDGDWTPPDLESIPVGEGYKDPYFDPRSMRIVRVRLVCNQGYALYEWE